ncbi:MAG: lysophospholipid acyltransferase family protein [Ignavibacteria bacterium]|nr:lysophospholipid acyltransferase family protein [Ignavibacteria bacterium]
MAFLPGSKINRVKDNAFRKSKFLISFFRHYFRNSLRRNFSNIYIKGFAPVLSALEISGKNKRPLIYCANHSSWWDVPVIIYLTYDLLNSDSYCLMEKKQFDVHPYFKGIGAVPIVREDPKDAVRVLAECTDYLNNTGKSLWIFPQGEIIPNGRRPVHFYSGVSHLLEKLKDPILVCTYLDFRFSGNQFPEIYTDFFHINFEVDPTKEKRSHFARQLAEMYEKQADFFESSFADGSLKDYELYLKGRKSVNDRSFTKFS